MTDPADYRLSEGQLAAEWRRIRARLFEDRQRGPQPKALFVGAQPGAGKSRAIEQLTRRDPNRDFVRLDSDELRKFHPRFGEILRADPYRMPVLTNQAASAWQRLALDHARAGEFDVIVENTFHDADAVATEAERFKAAGYQVHVVALGVPAIDSRLSMVDRYLVATAIGEPARWTNLRSHNIGYDGAPTTLERLSLISAVDRLTVIDRAGAVEYDSDPDGRHPGDAAQALNRLRDEPKTVALAQEWLNRYEQVRAAAVTSGTAIEPYAGPVLDQLAEDARTMTEVLTPAAPSAPDSRSPVSRARPPVARLPRLAPRAPRASEVDRLDDRTPRIEENGPQDRVGRDQQVPHRPEPDGPSLSR